MSGFNILTHDGPVYFSVLRLKRKNDYLIYLKTYFVSFRENGLSTCYILQEVALINNQYLTNYTRYENNV